MNGADTIERLVGERRSCRAFLPRQVDEDTLARMFALAQRTASFCNTQPWQVEVTRGEATARFAAAYARELEAGTPASDFPFPTAYQGIYGQRRRECARQLYESLGIAQGDRPASRQQALRNYALFDAPHVAIITSDSQLGVYGAIDCGGYLAHILLIAQALGLGAIAQGALATHAAFVRRHFGLDESRRVVCGISFGYADLDAPANAFKTSRAAVEDTVRWHGGTAVENSLSRLCE